MAEDPNNIEAEMLREEVSRLRESNATLESEKARLQSELHGLHGSLKLASGFATLVAFGPGLVASLQTWLEANTQQETLPIKETAEVCAAVTRRVLSIGLLGIIIACVPTAIMWRQAELMSSQNELIRQQNMFFKQQISGVQDQIAQQATTEILSRRAQLVDAIYSTLECPPSTKRCPPRNSARIRAESAVAFIEIERNRNVVPNLAKVNFAKINLSAQDMRGVDLSQADFSDANLSGADMSRAVHEMKENGSGRIRPDKNPFAYSFLIDNGLDFPAEHLPTLATPQAGSDLGARALFRSIAKDASLADITRSSIGEEVALSLVGTRLNTCLEGAVLLRANMVMAKLTHANLKGANLGEANLTGADLLNANLDKSNLTGATLSGANFRDTHMRETILLGSDLRGAVLVGAILDEVLLEDAKLEGADISGADLSHATGLVQAQVDAALGDSQTQLPPNLKRPNEWTKQSRQKGKS